MMNRFSHAEGFLEVFFVNFGVFFYRAKSREFYLIRFIKKELNQKVRKMRKNLYFCFFSA